ncbi:dTDP-4-dehydrorhamnose reductase [Henriciella sp. AS95]|uniref:dTDP-4-dehydrorhamnose reductase n=1 Tax=Henriciella sp. AS95 TaxID=3135782 RepID=UPI00317D2995
MTILVIGNKGQVARALVERAGGDVDVVALGRPALDITDETSIRAAFEAHEPDLVINASAYTAVDKAESDEAAAFAVNRDGPAHLANVCAETGTPLIHYSTDYVFDGSKHGAYVATDPTAPLGVYGRSKLAGEQAISAAMNNYVILRTAWVYSPFGGNFVKTMLRLAADRDELSVVADQYGCPTSALDIADATFVVARQILDGHGRYGTYHLCGSGETNWHGLASEVFAVSGDLGGPSATAKPIPAADYPTPAARPANSRLDGAGLKQDYGIQLPDWRESVRACVARLISEGTTP